MIVVKTQFNLIYFSPHLFIFWHATIDFFLFTTTPYKRGFSIISCDCL